MKKTDKAVCLILAVILLPLSLSGCKSDVEATVYETRYLGYDKQYRMLSSIVSGGDKLYLLAYEISPFGGDTVIIATLNESGEKTDSFSYNSEQFPALEENWVDQRTVEAIAADGSGNLWLLEQRYSVQVLDADEAEYSGYSLDYALTKVDAKGKVLFSLDINELFAGRDGFGVRKQLLCDGEGRVYLLLQDGDSGKLRIYGGDGTFLYEPDADISSIAASENSVVAALSPDKPGEGYSLCTIDAETRSMGEKRGVDIDCHYTYGGFGGKIYINNSRSLFSFDVATGKTAHILDWTDSDLSSGDTPHFAALPDGRFVILGMGIYSTERDVLMLEPVPESSVPEKTILTLATGHASQQLKTTAVEFNRSSDEYKIKIVDYSTFDTHNDPLAGRNRLFLEIMSGQIPDIIDFFTIPPNVILAAGLMEDLHPYLESDPELSAETFLPSLINAIETDGALYYLPVSFYLNLVIGDGNVLGDERNWTIDDLYAAVEANPQYDSVFSTTWGQLDFLYTAIQFNLGSYVNWADGTCNFETDDFKTLLAFTKEHFSAEGGEDYFLYGQQIEDILDKRQMLYYGSMTDIMTIRFVCKLFGDNPTFVGFPTEEGSGSAFVARESFGITRVSAHKDAAWDFIRRFYLTESYDPMKDSYFPANIAKLENMFAEAMKQNFEETENGEKVEYPRAYFGDFEIYALTREEADELWELLLSIDRIYTYELSLRDIVFEEAGAYFAGAKTAVETASLIQSKVSLFLGERKQ